MGSTHFGPGLALHSSAAFSETKESVLTRVSGLPKPEAGSRKPDFIQSQVDNLVSHFVEEATDAKVLAAMMAGSMAYRYARVGVMAMVPTKLGPITAMPLQWISVGLGLGSEVIAFEGTIRFAQTVGANLATEGSPGGIFTLERGGRSQGLPLQTLSPVTCHPSPNLWAWSGPGGLGQGLLSSFLTFGMLKGAGFLGREQNIIFQQVFQGTAMVAGHQLAAGLNIIPRSEGSLPEQFLHAEAMNLQMMAGMGLVHVMVPAVNVLERKLDLPLRDRRNLPIFQMVMAGVPLSEGRHPSTGSGQAGEQPLQKSKNPLPLFVLSEATQPGGSLEDKAERLTQHFLPLFPNEASPNIVKAIVGAAVKTPHQSPHFHSRLLEAYVRSPQAGSKGQLYTAITIQDVFDFNALHSSTGSFEEALLQHLVERVMEEEDPDLRARASRMIFHSMERGTSRSDLVSLLRLLNYHYGERLETLPEDYFPLRIRAMIDQECPTYRPEDRLLLLNFVHGAARGDSKRLALIIGIFGKALRPGRYAPEDVFAALDYARDHPFGKIVLRRILNIFAVEDIPAKLKELRIQPEGADTFSSIWNFLLDGYSPSAIARKINGTLHTAYLNDLRLAYKWVNVALDVYWYVELPEKRIANLRRLERSMDSFLKSDRPLSPEEIFKLLEGTPNPHIDRLRKFLFDEKKFQVVFRPDAEFEEEAMKIEVAGGKDIPLYFKSSKVPGEPDQIVIRQMPPKETSFENRKKALFDILTGFPHEGEHFLHTQGIYAEAPEALPLIRLLKIGRHDRLVSEMLSLLEEMRLRLATVDNDFIELARRRGLNISFYLRNLTDYSYYGAVNERLAKSLRGPQ